MGEIRVVVLAFFTLIAARMLGELPGCFGSFFGECGYGLIIIVPFLLSTYFVDSIMSVMDKSEDVKDKLINLIFCAPYIAFVGFVIKEFFASISIVTVEYILAFETIYAALFYILVFMANNQKIVRRLNKIFMISFLITVSVFLFLI